MGFNVSEAVVQILQIWQTELFKGPFFQTTVSYAKKISKECAWTLKTFAEKKTHNIFLILFVQSGSIVIF